MMMCRSFLTTSGPDADKDFAQCQAAEARRRETVRQSAPIVRARLLLRSPFAFTPEALTDEMQELLADTMAASVDDGRRPSGWAKKSGAALRSIVPLQNDIARLYDDGHTPAQIAANTNTRLPRVTELLRMTGRSVLNARVESANLKRTQDALKVAALGMVKAQIAEICARTGWPESRAKAARKAARGAAQE